MTHRLAICLAIASLTFAAPRPAAASVTNVFDTVDAVEIGFVSSSTSKIVVTGILAGGSVPTTITFTFNIFFQFANGGPSGFLDMAPQCERLAVIAMSKPGKFQFAIGSITGGGSPPAGGCKLILRTP